MGLSDSEVVEIIGVLSSLSAATSLIACDGLGGSSQGASVWSSMSGVSADVA